MNPEENPSREPQVLWQSQPAELPAVPADIMRKAREQQRTTRLNVWITAVIAALFVALAVRELLQHGVLLGRLIAAARWLLPAYLYFWFTGGYRLARFRSVPLGTSTAQFLRESFQQQVEFYRRAAGWRGYWPIVVFFVLTLLANLAAGRPLMRPLNLGLPVIATHSIGLILLFVLLALMFLAWRWAMGRMAAQYEREIKALDTLTRSAQPAVQDRESYPTPDA
jgi:hypothetical protein